MMMAGAKKKVFKVLVGEDHPVFRKGLRHLFKLTKNFRVVSEVDNGSDVLEKIREEDVDLVLLDLELPGKNGLDVLKEIKATHPQLPVLVVSMYPEEDYAIRLMRAGAAGYICKSQPLEEIVQGAQKILESGKFINQRIAEQLAREFDLNFTKPLHESLTTRQFQILCLIGKGNTTKEIAAKLHLSLPTINTHRANILSKLNLSNTSQLINYAWKHGLVK